MAAIEGHEEVKLEPEETIAEKIKINLWKGEITRLKTLLTKVPILSTQIKALNSSRKVKSKIRQTIYLLYQCNEITINVSNNLINSL